MKTRREFLTQCAAGAGALTLAGYTDARSGVVGKDKPNYLFIAVDDLRPQLGCYGKQLMHTPNIDALAEGALTFDNAYCQVAVCGASRASLLTGISPWSSDYLERADKKVTPDKSLPGYLKQNGYRTVGISKIFHHSDDCLDGWTNYVGVPNVWLDYQNDHGDKRPTYEFADADDSEYNLTKATDNAIEQLRECAEGSEPFFLAAGIMRPHLPFTAPKKYWDLYDHSEIPLPEWDHDPLNSFKSEPDYEIGSYDFPDKSLSDEEKTRTLIHAYYATVSYVDAQVGRLLDELDELGLSDNTVVIFWGDHGFELGEHGKWAKHSSYEVATHCPLIFRVPGMAQGVHSSGLVEFVDLFPTICDLSGLEHLPQFEGYSMAPLLENPAAEWKTAVFWHWRKRKTIRTTRYRYTEWSDKRELYDLQEDPLETINIAEDEENEGLVTSLSQRLAFGRPGELPDITTGKEIHGHSRKNAGHPTNLKDQKAAYLANGRSLRETTRLRKRRDLWQRIFRH